MIPEHMRVLFVFVDGIGLGASRPSNPFVGLPLEVLGPLGGRESFAGASYAALDPSLGYPGLPQSATGQGVLFTGEDLIGVAGGHWPGRPTPTLARKIAEYSFLRRAREAGLRGGFLNAFDEARAAHVARVVAGEERPSKRWAPSASSWAAVAGGGALRTFRDVDAGRAATFDLTGELLRSVGVAAPKRTLKEAAQAVAAGAAELDVALFELFLTDEAGHSQSLDFARTEILRTDRFLTALFEAIDPREQLVMVTSDHGNLEDLSTRSHTRAAVPLLVGGSGGDEFIKQIHTLKDVAPTILRTAAPQPTQEE